MYVHVHIVAFKGENFHEFRGLVFSMKFWVCYIHQHGGSSIPRNADFLQKFMPLESFLLYGIHTHVCMHTHNTCTHTHTHDTCTHITQQVIWKQLYKQSSASDHGTLEFFRCKLNRTTVSTDVTKDVNATLDFSQSSRVTFLQWHVKYWASLSLILRSICHPMLSMDRIAIKASILGV